MSALFVVLFLVEGRYFIAAKFQKFQKNCARTMDTNGDFKRCSAEALEIMQDSD